MDLYGRLLVIYVAPRWLFFVTNLPRTLLRTLIGRWLDLRLRCCCTFGYFTHVVALNHVDLQPAFSIYYRCYVLLLLRCPVGLRCVVDYVTFICCCLFYGCGGYVAYTLLDSVAVAIWLLHVTI